MDNHGKTHIICIDPLCEWRIKYFGILKRYYKFKKRVAELERIVRRMEVMINELQ